MLIETVSEVSDEGPGADSSLVLAQPASDMAKRQNSEVRIEDLPAAGSSRLYARASVK
jgi:hypothetical protein